MATINVGEDDFTVVASGAMDAEARGDLDEARALDKLARKINAALASGNSARQAARALGVSVDKVSWRDMPSVLKEATNAR